MRKNLARLVSVLALAGLVGAGCKVSVSAGSEPKAPPAAKPQPKPAPPPPQRKRFDLKKLRVNKDNRVELPGPIVFETDSDQLKPESEPVLELVQIYLQEKKEVDLLRIEGHTDSQGDDAHNMDLSKRRALAVSRWLVAKGIECKRLRPVGFGETKPVESNDTPEGREANRRVAFYNAIVNHKPVGSGPVDANGEGAGDPCL